MNRHFVRTDDGGVVLYGFSTAFEPPQEGDVCIAEEAGYQFQLFGLENPPLRDELGVPLYKLEDGAVVARTEDEMKPEREAAEEARNQAVEAAAKTARQLDQAARAASLMFVAAAEAGDLDDVTIADHPDLFIVWDEHWTGKRDAIVLDEGQLWRSRHDVGNGQNTKPGETPSMWAAVIDPSAGPQLWSRPGSADDYLYQIGDECLWPEDDPKRWVSTAGNNVWEPGVYGWREVG